jgi:hypothetical protein
VLLLLCLFLPSCTTHTPHDTPLLLCHTNCICILLPFFSSPSSHPPQSTGLRQVPSSHLGGQGRIVATPSRARKTPKEGEREREAAGPAPSTPVVRRVSPVRSQSQLKPCPESSTPTPTRTRSQLRSQSQPQSATDTPIQTQKQTRSQSVTPTRLRLENATATPTRTKSHAQTHYREHQQEQQQQEQRAVTPPFPELSAYVFPYANTDRGHTYSAPDSPMTERERREEMERREIERAKEIDLDFERAWQREMEDKENGIQATSTSALHSAANTTEKDRTPHRYGTPPPPPRAQTPTQTQTPLALALVQSSTPSLPRTKSRSVSAGRVQTQSQTNSVGSGSGSASGGTNHIPPPLPPSATPKRVSSSSYLTPKKGPTPALGVMVSPPPSFAGSVQYSLCRIEVYCTVLCSTALYCNRTVRLMPQRFHDQIYLLAVTIVAYNTA